MDVQSQATNTANDRKKISYMTEISYFSLYILKQRTSWNHLERVLTTSIKLEPPGITSNKVEPPVTRWIHQRTDTKNRKFIGRNCASNNTSQKNTILARNSYCHKEYHLGVSRWNLHARPLSRRSHWQGGTEWNQYWANTKTLIGHYCVYNIIDLHNITLQIVIVLNTYCSIWDFDKASQIRLFFIYTLNKKIQQLSMEIRLVLNH